MIFFKIIQNSKCLVLSCRRWHLTVINSCLVFIELALYGLVILLELALEGLHPAEDVLLAGRRRQVCLGDRVEGGQLSCRQRGQQTGVLQVRWSPAVHCDTPHLQSRLSVQDHLG